MSDSFLQNIERSISSTLNDGETLHDDNADTNTTSQDSNEQASQQTTNDQGNETETATEQQQQDGTRSDQQDASKQPGGKPSTQQQQQQPTQQQQQRRPHAAQNGDLVDPSTGRVIARAGQERRFYEGMNRERSRAASLESQLRNASAQIDAYKNASTLHTQLGLTPDHVTTALHFMSHFNKDPMKAAENMLAQMAASGYDLSQLGVGVQVSAIRQMMDERLQPFTQDRAHAQREAEIRDAVTREINEIAGEFSWFNANQHVVDKVMQEAPDNVSLREVVLRVENWAIRNGLDLDGDLESQYLEKMGRQQQEQPPATMQQQQQPAPNRARGSVPSVNGGNAGQNVPRTTAPANANRSNRDIVREAMREYGYGLDS